MPTGAMNVPLCFSAASMKMTKISSAVRNISMKSPRATDVPAPRVVRTFRTPGTRDDTTAALVMPPTIWAETTTAPRVHGTAPTRHKPNVTCNTVSE